MTAKEKAQQIYRKYKNLADMENDLAPVTATIMAMQAAIISVDEIITTLENVSFDYSIGLTTEHKWWREVKQELERL